MPVAHLYPQPPYDFSLSDAIFAGGNPQIRTYEHDIFCQALDIGCIPVLVEVFSEGSADRPELRLSLRLNTTFSKSMMKGIQDLVSSMFNITEDIYTILRGYGGGCDHDRSHTPAAGAQSPDDSYHF